MYAPPFSTAGSQVTRHNSLSCTRVSARARVTVHGPGVREVYGDMAGAQAATYAEVTRLLSTMLLLGRGGDYRPAPVLRENMVACIRALQAAYSSGAAMDADRKSLEAAILASRPAAERAAADTATVHNKVTKRFRDLRGKAFP